MTEIRADFDGDGKEDWLQWFPQTAGSSIPADYASVTLTLSSTERPLTLEETYVSVLRYESRYYVAATSVAHGKVPSKTSIYAVGPSGFRRLCAFMSRRKYAR
jgi:hypothetical protein